MAPTDLEKGYVCPDDCPNCPLMKTVCTVYSKKGQAFMKKWREEHKEETK